MSEVEEDIDVVADLRGRVDRLEGLYSLIDLLGLPGLLAGGAATVFDTLQTADSLDDQAPGFYPKENPGGGLAVRWTKFPEAAELCVPALEGYPFRVELIVQPAPHMEAADDIVFTLSEVGQVPFAAPVAHESGGSLFAGGFLPTKSGLLTASITSRTFVEGPPGDQRRLGVPFISLRTFPFLKGAVGDRR